MNKKILILAMFYAPNNTIAAVRITKIAKYLKRSGADVRVICGEYLVPSLAEDPILAKDAQDIPSARIRYGGFFYKIARFIGDTRKKDAAVPNAKKTLFACAAAGIFEFLAGVYLLLAEKNWAARCYSYIERNFHGEKFDACITSYGPLSCTLAGCKLKRKGITGKWIMDFRDPPENHEKRRLMRAYIAKKLPMLFGLADSLTFASEGLLSDMQGNTGGRTAFTSDKAHVITNGYDPEDGIYIERERPSRKLTITYCGTIYARQTPVALFEAITRLSGEARIDPDNIEIHYAGAQGSDFKRHAGELGRIIIDHGYIDRRQSINLQRSSDILLILAWNQEVTGGKGILTGKFFEALLVGRPVLGLISGEKPDSEIGRVIRKYDLGHACEDAEAGSKDALALWLQQKYDEKRASGSIAFSPEPGVLEKYSYSCLAAEFLELV